MRTIIAGSRSITDYLAAVRFMEVFHREHGISVVLSGGARGVDAMGEQWAAGLGIPIERFPADWAQGRAAGPIRNAEMVKCADAILVIWDGESRGTADIVRKATAAGLHPNTMVVMPA